MAIKSAISQAPLIRWNPWNLRQILDKDWDIPTIPGISRLAGQGLNLYETDDAIVAEAAMPGIPDDRVDVTIDDGVVRVTGSYEEKAEDKDKRHYFMSSMASSYNYSFRLPEGVRTDKEPVCELDEGVLKLSFEKAEKTPPKRIKVGKAKKMSKLSPSEIEVKTKEK
ncbi:Hsp20/alpha crystallin family protein [Candidatus Daviesbacteria bacterium]|nr:Hsp20/alpha crystallin family protein [Candidatus Daviesbacteria bacterium]